MGESVTQKVGTPDEIVRFYCKFHTQMSEWIGYEDPYLSEYEGELFVFRHDDVDEPRLAGHARLFVLNADAAENDREAPSVFDLLDMRGDTAAYMSLLHSTKPDKFSPEICRILRENWARPGNMLILDQLEILPEFRGQQLALRYIGTAIRQFGSGCRIAAIKPFPSRNSANRIPSGMFE